MATVEKTAEVLSMTNTFSSLFSCNPCAGQPVVVRGTLRSPVPRVQLHGITPEQQIKSSLRASSISVNDFYFE